MKIKKQLLNSYLFKIKTLSYLKSFTNKINFLNKGEELFNTNNKIKERNFILYDRTITLRNPIKKLMDVSGKISFKKIIPIHISENIIVLKYKPDFSIFMDKGYSKFIENNIEYLYEKISNYYDKVYELFIKKYPLRGKESKMEFSEKIFDFLLFKLDMENHKKLEDITDDNLVMLLVDYFKTNL